MLGEGLDMDKDVNYIFYKVLIWLGLGNCRKALAEEGS